MKFEIFSKEGINYLFFLVNQLEKIAASTVFENDPQVIPRLIPVEEAQDISVFEVVKDTHLLNSIFNDI